MAIRIFLADDHHILRQGLKSLLQAEDDFRVIGEADDGQEAVVRIGQLKPDVVVMDLRMPRLSGIEATRQALHASPITRIIGLSGHSDDHTAREMLRAGASGYMLKDAAYEELATAIRTVHAGKIYLSPSISNMIVRDYMNVDRMNPACGFVNLSPRERDILQHLSDGKSTKEIASMLQLSAKTVETHRRNIMGKTRVKSVAELTKYAIRAGITSL